MAIVPIAISIALALPATLMGRTSTNALTHLAQRGIATALIGLAIALGIKLVVEVPFQVRWLRLVVLGESTPRGRGGSSGLETTYGMDQGVEASAPPTDQEMYCAGKSAA